MPSQYGHHQLKIEHRLFLHLMQPLSANIGRKDLATLQVPSLSHRFCHSLSMWLVIDCLSNFKQVVSSNFGHRLLQVHPVLHFLSSV